MEVYGASQKKKNQQFGRLNSNRSSNDTNDYGSLFAGLFELPRSISILPFFLSYSLRPFTSASFIETLYSSATINLSSRIYLVEREIMSFHPIIIVIIIQKLLLNKKKI